MKRGHWLHVLRQFTTPCPEWPFEWLPRPESLASDSQVANEDPGHRRWVFNAKTHHVPSHPTSDTGVSESEFRCRLVIVLRGTAVKLDDNGTRFDHRYRADLVDTSCEDSLQIYWRERKGGCNSIRWEEGSAAVPWEDIVAIEYVCG